MQRAMKIWRKTMRPRIRPPHLATWLMSRVERRGPMDLTCRIQPKKMRLMTTYLVKITQV
jgi:hypothetical protein